MNLCESFLFRKVSIFGILTMVKVICTMTCVRTCVRDYLCVHVWECAHARVWRKIGFFSQGYRPLLYTVQMDNSSFPQALDFKGKLLTNSQLLRLNN